MSSAILPGFGVLPMGSASESARNRIRNGIARAKGILEFNPKGCIIVVTEWPGEWPEGKGPADVDYFCNATPIGEEWPQCYLKKGHTGRHESIDQWWDNDNPIAMKRY